MSFPPAPDPMAGARPRPFEPESKAPAAEPEPVPEDLAIESDREEQESPRSETGPPVTPGSATLADYGSGVFGALGVLLALRARDVTGEGQMIGYYASFAMPSLSCRRFGSGSPMGPGVAQTSAGMQEYGRLTQALASSHMDKRFSISQSGPSLPLGRFSLYDAVTFQGKSGGGASFETERGNVRSISASDPIFSVPSDFTKNG